MRTWARFSRACSAFPNDIWLMGLKALVRQHHRRALNKGDFGIGRGAGQAGEPG